MLDGIEMSSQNLIYMCMVRMIPRLQYIAWEDVLKKGEKSSNLDNKRINSCNFVHQQDIIQAPQAIPRMVLFIFLVFNSF